MLEISNKIRDRYFKIAGLPVTVVLVVCLQGLFTTTQKITWSLADYLFLIVVAFFIWAGNVKIHYALRKKLYEVKRIALRLALRYSINIVYSFNITLVMLSCWNYFFHDGVYQQKTIFMLQVLMILISLQVSSIYEIVYLNKERESDIVKIERTEKLKIQAQLDSLKSQLDPHFIFNSLNTLSYLISQSQDSARLFNDTLAKVYRYILVKKEIDLVLLKEEVEFAANYFYLLKIRYQQGLFMKIEIDFIDAENYLLPPLSIQMLVDNAIKHNHFNEKIPLNIGVNIVEDSVTVTNNRSVKKYEIQSSQIGLKNLGERYQLLTGRNISYEGSQNAFTVVLPILKC